MFAALNTAEPPIVVRENATVLECDRSWFEERQYMVEDRIRDRLGDLSRRLGNADWLHGAFSAGDLLMVGVLRRLDGSTILNEFPNLFAYVTAPRRGPPSSAHLTLN
ncbi:glutathione S-transferase [Novosphingopyxis sp.]|uniref:glutathione S-transferase n=1 Tax=Novosphingopyxis sp. TaxID=2709690 RepID=UPI003B59A8B1